LSCPVINNWCVAEDDKDTGNPAWAILLPDDIQYTGMHHDARFAARTLRPRFPIPDAPGNDAAWIFVSGTGIVIKSPAAGIFSRENPAHHGLDPGQSLYIGHMGNTPVYAADIPAGSPVPDGWSFSDIRSLSAKISDDELAIAALAVQLVDFDRTTRYCGRCGTKTHPLRSERSKLCPGCNQITYPRLSPAIIVLVQNGDSILLARSPGFPAGMYSLIAGFAEPGETIEGTVQREVSEEVGLTVKNIRYAASEPWPFPHSLMIGFTADYAGGDLLIDNKEIESAGWFCRDNLPPLPATLSLSRALIDAWVKKEL
jgi:NAD+ diphosphatase